MYQLRGLARILSHASQHLHTPPLHLPDRTLGQCRPRLSLEKGERYKINAEAGAERLRQQKANASWWEKGLGFPVGARSELHGPALLSPGRVNRKAGAARFKVTV